MPEDVITPQTCEDCFLGQTHSLRFNLNFRPTHTLPEDCYNDHTNFALCISKNGIKMNREKQMYPIVALMFRRTLCSRSRDRLEHCVH